MHVRLLGDLQDVTGFALAGVEGTECGTRAELIRALEDARRDPSVAVVMLSARVAALADDVVRDMHGAAQLPIAIVLPDLSETERVAKTEAPA